MIRRVGATEGGFLGRSGEGAEWVMAKDNRDVGPGGLSSSLHFPNSELGTGEWEDPVHGRREPSRGVMVPGTSGWTTCEEHLSALPLVEGVNPKQW